MIRFRHLSVALLGALAIAPAAFAQDSNFDSTNDGKRFAVVGGFAVSEPTSDPTIAGASTQFDGGTAATLSASWYFHENFAVEAWGAADKFDHRVRDANNYKIGSVESQPYALSAQYHFGNSEQIVRPFLGLGYYESNFDNETPEPTGPLAGQRIGVETAKGAMATAGLDVTLSPSWFARADLRYLHGDSDVKVSGDKVGNAKLNPVVVGLGLGVRF
ncbi:outer membrane beta-barrel protein [Lysobacter ciconiae]|uniref:Outer membrane beta-barrel protein n=1 Tax=Novilysobacter ciconiae TaxID=2781022 RepID=A0A7S6ZRZ4_9GAMM|nr:OmpW family outer membrane protein [Lysobacter ciconiae]QOW19247.1 outer membrane beta-barrel protein [Lysobacter ciconiae]